MGKHRAQALSAHLHTYIFPTAYQHATMTSKRMQPQLYGNLFSTNGAQYCLPHELSLTDDGVEFFCCHEFDDDDKLFDDELIESNTQQLQDQPHVSPFRVPDI